MLLYDDNLEQQQQEPMWGQIVREKPETELEELKQLTFRNREEKRAGSSSDGGVKKPKALFTTTSAPPAASSSMTPKHPAAPLHLIHSEGKPSHLHGQKEIPLLRPPTAPKTPEPAPIITQRSLSVEKPSPYDTLRKYLSIEDALKKVILVLYFIVNQI
jgi:hypothetical protein